MDDYYSERLIDPKTHRKVETYERAVELADSSAKVVNETFVRSSGF